MMLAMPTLRGPIGPFRHPGGIQGRIVSIGSEAQGLLARLATARVVAAFQSSLYLRSGEHWACLGTSDIGRGPLNVTCELLQSLDWRELVSPDDVPVPWEAGFSLGTLTLSTVGAAVWRPGLAPLHAPRQLESGLAALMGALPANLPAEGLAWFLCGRESCFNAVARAALPPVEVLSGWLRGEGGDEDFPASASEAVRSLLGLGPGLTPSGDDFLAGLLIALHSTGRTAEARRLGRVIANLAPHHTNAISTAHLMAALRAGLSEDLHNLIGAVVQGEAAAIAACLSRLAGTTHCSSWDALAGAATAFRSLLALQEAGLEPR